MTAMAAPLPAGNVEAWEAWIGELTGPRNAEFEEMNERLGLTEHRAYLQPTPEGDYLVLVVHEGPGAEEFLPNVMASDHAFDTWFREQVVALHGIDPSGPPPPMAARRL